MLLVRGICKLLLLVVEACPPLGVKPIDILPNHAVGDVQSEGFPFKGSSKSHWL